MRRRYLTCAVVVALFGLSVPPLSAEVVRVEVQSRSDLLAGQPFGAAGPYEKIAGKAFFAVDPSVPANKIVADLDKAPRNAAGKVEFSSDFYIIKPKNIAKGNGAVLYEVSNRGGKGMLGFFNHASGSANPGTAAEMGDGFLMRQGFTLLWVGWQFDVPGNGLRVYTPVASDNGRPIRGVVRSDFVVTERETDHSLADRNHAAYAVLDPGSPDNVLTVRDTVNGQRRIVPRNQWSFTPDRTRVSMTTKFETGKIYEVVYTAENPPVVGLGPAAIRDFITMLKYKSADALAIPGGAISRATAFGISQSGRFLRTYLYYGFNRSEDDRKVFDGVIAQVAGAGRGSFNHRFRAAVARRPPIHQLLLSDGHLSVHRRRPEGSGDGSHRWVADARRVPGPAAEDLLHQLRIRVLGPRRVADSHHGRRQSGRATDGQRAHLSAGGGAARTGRVSPDADHRPAAQQPPRLSMGDEGAAAVDGSVDG
jgi:hypothetical protein